MMRVGSSATRLACVVLVALAGSSLAYPKYYYDPKWLEMYGMSLPEPATCTSHPTAADGLYISPHGVPKVNSAYSFIFSDAATGALVTSLCPGSTYNLMVVFGIPTSGTALRLGLLTSDPALANFTSPAPTPGCNNRVDLGGSNEKNARTNYTTTFTLPCSAAGTSINFRVTSAGKINPQAKLWTTNNVTIAVAGSQSADILAGGQCEAAAAACGIYAPPTRPPKPPTRSPPPKSRSPPPPKSLSPPPKRRSPPPRSRHSPPIRFITRPPPQRHH